MLVNIKALIVVLVAALPVFLFFRASLARLIGDQRYMLWAMMWLTVTVIAFTITNFWLFCLFSTVAVGILSANERMKPALFGLLVVAAPPITTSIQGFAGINKFIDVSPQLMIVMALMLPLMLFSSKLDRNIRSGRSVDVLVWTYIIYGALLALREPTFTHTLRVSINEFMLIGPVYFAVSRSLKTTADMKILTVALVLPALALSATTMFEFVMNWHFYAQIPQAWNLDASNSYKLRDGFLRATASAQNSISWGFIAAVSIGFGLAIFNDRIPKLAKLAGFGLLAASLIVSLSRGPWIGAVLMVGVFALTSGKAFTRIIQLGVFGVIGLGVAAVSPFGQDLIDLLPFVGNSGDGSITYRQELLTVSLDVIRQSPWFGFAEPLLHPDLQVMRQGEGIIDLVNTFIEVALERGLIGLLIYVLIILTVMRALYKAMRRARGHSAEISLYARAFFATLIGATFIIFTTSSLNPINFVFWFLLAGSIAVVRLEERAFASAGVEVVKPDQPKEQQAVGDEAFAWK